MALSFEHGPRFVAGDKRFHIAEVTFDSSYPTGGEQVTAADFGLKNLDYAFVTSPKASGHSFYYDQDTRKILGYTSSGTEISSGTSISTNKVQVLAIGV